jgi:hypothetical protein
MKKREFLATMRHYKCRPKCMDASHVVAYVSPSVNLKITGNQSEKTKRSWYLAGVFIFKRWTYNIIVTVFKNIKNIYKYPCMLVLKILIKRIIRLIYYALKLYIYIYIYIP